MKALFDFAAQLSVREPAGSALAFQDVVIHLELFPANGGAQQAFRLTRIARPSQRGPRY